MYRPPRWVTRWPAIGVGGRCWCSRARWQPLVSAHGCGQGRVAVAMGAPSPAGAVVSIDAWGQSVVALSGGADRPRGAEQLSGRHRGTRQPWRRGARRTPTTSRQHRPAADVGGRAAPSSRPVGGRNDADPDPAASRQSGPVHARSHPRCSTGSCEYATHNVARCHWRPTATGGEDPTAWPQRSPPQRQRPPTPARRYVRQRPTRQSQAPAADQASAGPR